MIADRCSSGLSFALLLASLPSISVAAGSDEAGARVLFAEGRKLVASGNYLEACPKFEESFRLDPGIGTNFNLADCLEHTGRTASAWGRFLDVAAGTKAAGQGERERVARARAAALEPRLPRLIVRVSPPVEGLLVERDGVVLGQTSWGVSLPVDPGEHLVTAVAAGKRKWSQKVQVPDAPITLSLSVPTLEPLPPEPIMASLAASPSLVQPSEPSRRLSIPVISLGVLGTVALGAGIALGFKVQGENGEAKALCPASTCQNGDEKARHDSLVSEARRDQKLALVSAGVGGAAILAAAYLWWRPIRSPSIQEPIRKLSFGVLTTPVGVQFEMGW